MSVLSVRVTKVLTLLLMVRGEEASLCTEGVLGG